MMHRVVALLALFVSSCAGGGGGARDGGLADAGMLEGGTGDASGRDGSAPDAGARDASLDAPPADAGGPLDGGMDPPRECVVEACNGLDDDCDGTVDEGCVCLPGEIAACFRGDPRHRGTGACSDGMMVCTDGLEFGTWGPCTGDLVEAPDTCDAAGLDEDCDGAPNDGCECIDGDPAVPCGTDVGACAEGVQRCVAGRRTACEGAIGAAPETCNDVDDDCDGAVDEELVRACGVDVRPCRAGTETCSAGAWGACTGGVMPGPEVCDALDDDCDGMTDEDVTRVCGTDVGRCIAGVETCVDGAFGGCDGSVGPVSEICNDVDDDCDGMTDEGLARSCGTDVGECTAGTETCRPGTGWSLCSGSTGPATELCDGLLDENCDGTIDEGCGCVSGATRPCGTDTGECRAGSQLCSSGAWGACAGDIGPAAELCNGLDDDCDSLIDEGCDCISGATRGCGTDIGACVAGTETCDAAGRWGLCAGAVEPTPEVCNGSDDDCDSMIDEGGVCPRIPPVAMCPMPVSTLVGTAVTLVGGGSDPDGGPVTLAWTVASRPVGSTAMPAPPDTATTRLTPDAAGDFLVRLCVTDDEAVTTCCTVTVTATPSCTLPTTPVLTVCPTSWDRRPVVELTPVPAGITYDLFKDADALPYASLSLDGQNYHRPAGPLGPGGPPPGTTMTIYARACRDADPSCCTASAPVTVSLVEACATPVAPTASNVLFSEYVIDGDGPCPGVDCEAGEAIEITNLSHCPVSLAGHHFSYCNPTCTTFRWMNFGVDDVIPPRGVYVSIRNRAASMCAYPFFGPDDPSLFGLEISRLAMMSDSSLASGWFNNSGGGTGVLRVATGAYTSITSGTTVELVSPYSGAAGSCESIGFDALDACGNPSAMSMPTSRLVPNQLGRLWHPCDAVVAPMPATCR